MAYRVEAVQGTSPFPTDQPLNVIDEEDGVAYLWAWAGETVDARIRLIPVDAAGNEGPPSNTITLSVGDGCSVSGRSATMEWLPVIVALLILRRRRSTRPHAPAGLEILPRV